MSSILYSQRMCDNTLNLVYTHYDETWLPCFGSLNVRRHFCSRVMWYLTMATFNCVPIKWTSPAIYFLIFRIVNPSITVLTNHTCKDRWTSCEICGKNREISSESSDLKLGVLPWTPQGKLCPPHISSKVITSDIYLGSRHTLITPSDK